MSSEVHALAKHTIRTLLRRLTSAGFAPDFVRRGVLPEWWDESCIDDPALLPDVEFRIARFLGVPVAVVREPDAPLTAPPPARVGLRKVRNIDGDRLSPAIHAGIRVAEAVVRSLREASRPAEPPPHDATAWWARLREQDGPVDLRAVATDLWRRGIPVVPPVALPSPKYQGLACVVLGRPVIVLGHAHDEPARLAFFIAHEIGHIVHGDCAPDQPVVDEDDEVLDANAVEDRADAYAWAALSGGRATPNLGEGTWREIANRAAAIEDERGVDAGATVWGWANRTQRFQDAQLALKALYLAQGGQRLLQELFEQFVHVAGANETDAALLACVGGGVERDAPAP